MKPILSLITSIVFLTLSQSAQASGFRCDGDSEAANLHVKLFNHVQPENGTRTPAALIVSDDQRGTLLTRRTTEIRKYNRQNTVQYVVEGNRKIDADRVILQIRFKEGQEVLPDGVVAQGQLILIQDDEKSVYQLTCERYLKSE